MSEQQSTAPDGGSPASQPAWRREFPIDVAEDNYIARRGFTKFMVLTSLAFVVGQVWIGLQNWLRKRRGQSPVIAITRLEDLPVGGARSFHYENETCLLVRTTADTLVAYNQKCTHLSCAVIPELDRGSLGCPCHRGAFDVANGRPTAGPPRRPLTRINLEVREGIVYATGVELRTV